MRGDLDRSAVPCSIADLSSAPSQRIQFAHLLRGLAAVTVVCFHYFGVFWAAPDVVGGLINTPVSLPARDAGVLTSLFAPGPFVNLGHFGVALFFLISGFVIPWSFARQSRLGFAVARAMRLWPTYAVGLTCTLLFLGLASVVFARPFPYSAADLAWHYALGLRDLVGSPSIDGIVWTLEIEVRFYSVCLIIAPWLRRAEAGRVIVAIAVVALTTGALDVATWRFPASGVVRLLQVLGMEGQGLVYMLIGTLFHLRLRGTLSPRGLAAGVIGTAAACAGLWRIGPEAAFLTAVAIGYGAALAVFAAGFVLRDRVHAGPIASWMADISYPLYAAHAIPGYVVMRLCLSAGLPPLACAAAAWVWAIGAAVLIHRLVEVPSHEAGRRWARRLGLSRR